MNDEERLVAKYLEHELDDELISYCTFENPDLYKIVELYSKNHLFQDICNYSKELLIYAMEISNEYADENLQY